MTNLSNKQLQVITDFIYNQITDKKEKYQTSKEYLDLLEKTKEEIKYNEKLTFKNEWERNS